MIFHLLMSKLYWLKDKEIPFLWSIFNASLKFRLLYKKGMALFIFDSQHHFNAWKKHLVNLDITFVPFLCFTIQGIFIHTTKAAGPPPVTLLQTLISLCWSYRMLWLEGSGTVADAKLNKRKAFEYWDKVGGENNKKSQQRDRTRNTSKMGWKLTLLGIAQDSKALQIKPHPTNASVPSHYWDSHYLLFPWKPLWLL